MLKHLMGVNDVELGVVEVQRVRISRSELHIVDFGRGIRPGPLHDRLGVVDSNYTTGRHPPSEINGEIPGTTPHIEDRHTRSEVSHEVGR
jgi:hypothetical protein